MDSSKNKFFGGPAFKKKMFLLKLGLTETGKFAEGEITRPKLGQAKRRLSFY